MAGLILLAVLVAVIALLVLLSGFITRRLPISAGWIIPLRMLIVVGAFPISVADEIIGKHQFESLCKLNGIESVKVVAAQGKRVKAEYGKRKLVQGTAIPIKEVDVFFKDVESNEILIRHKNYYATGGWLMRHTPLSMGSSRPMLFPASCTTDYVVRDAIFKQNNIILVNQ